VGERAAVDSEDGEVGAQSEERKTKTRKVKMRGTGTRELIHITTVHRTTVII